MAKAPKTPPLRPPGRPKQPLDPNKAVLAPPRLRPTTTRDYGKGGTPLSGSPNMGVRGAGIGYGGPPGYQEGGSVPPLSSDWGGPPVESDWVRRAKRESQ